MHVSLYFSMIEALIVSVVLLVAAVLLLGIRVFFVRNGKFPNTHIGGSKAMRDRGIGCAPSQDREAQKNSKHLNTNNIIQELTEKY